MSAGFHSYAHDKQEEAQRAVIVAAILAAAAWGKVAEVFHIPSPWWFDAPGPMAFVGMLAAAFNKWGWRWFHRIHGVSDLNGTYDLESLSSHDNHAQPTVGTLTIAQEWTRILVTVKTASSSSSSIGAWLSDDPTQGAVLTYAYRNEPDPAAKQDLHAHVGTATIIFDSNGAASGRYYTDRETFGSIRLTKRVAARAGTPPRADGTVASAAPASSTESDAKRS